jgi:ferredoxin
MGRGADYMIRRGLAREISRTEMLERVERSRELGLVLAADNVQKSVGFICHCCACCCNVLGAVTNYGYPNAIVSSSFEAQVDTDACNGCGKCESACPIDAIELKLPRQDAKKRERRARVQREACVGCGVCATRCPTGGLRLVARERRVFHPENTFERVIVQAVQAGTLQNLVFANPHSATEGFMRGLLGGFLRLDPVKRALVGDRLRSVFLQQLSSIASRRSSGISPGTL